MLLFVHVLNFWLHFMHNAIRFVDAFGISTDTYESCWIFSQFWEKEPHQNSVFLFKVYSLKMVLIIINKSSLIVFFCTSFSFISQIAANSFFISQKHSVNTGSSQPVCGWCTSNIKPYRQYVASLHWFTASAIMKTTESES